MKRDELRKFLQLVAYDGDMKAAVSILHEFDRLTARIAELENYIDPLALAKAQKEDEG